MSMKILEILRSAPDENVTKIIDVHKQDNDVKVAELYSGDPDYAALVDDIFASDKVITWW
jgi:hypothetical protein